MAEYIKRLQAILSKGFFPKELPQVFTTESFGQQALDIIGEWRVNGVYKITQSGKVPGTNKRKNSAYSYDITNTEMEVISKPKRGYERRSIHIIHPIPQSVLAYELSNNWPAIQKWLSRQRFSLDRIEISDQYARSVRGIKYNVHQAKKGHIEAVSDWIVRTDITRFYSTIYTHSIPWAAYGKEQVKRNLRLYGRSLADRLDVLVRACNRNQTIGLPVGPETSRIISEIISSRIDDDFRNIHTEISQNSADRLQDDWLVGVETFEKAENILASISKVYGNYGLEINGSKTTVNRIIANSTPDWISEISAFLSHRPGIMRGARLRELFILTLKLQVAHSSQPVISYTLTILESHSIESEDVELVEAFLLKSAVISPISLDRICRIFINLQFNSNKISKARIGQRFQSLAENSMKNDNTYELMWLLYTMRGLRISLTSKFITDGIEIYPSSVISLLLLDMQSKRICVRRLPKDEWVGRYSADDIMSNWSWLLMYEGIRNGWLTDRNALMTTPFFKALSDRNVYFYDKNKNVQNSRTVTRERVRMRKIESLDIINFLARIREMPLDY